MVVILQRGTMPFVQIRCDSKEHKKRTEQKDMHRIEKQLARRYELYLFDRALTERMALRDGWTKHGDQWCCRICRIAQSEPIHIPMNHLQDDGME